MSDRARRRGKLSDAATAYLSTASPEDKAIVRDTIDRIERGDDSLTLPTSGVLQHRTTMMSNAHIMIWVEHSGGDYFDIEYLGPAFDA